FPRGVQPENVPVAIGKAEITRSLLGFEPRIREQHFEIGMAAGIHVMVSVERPGSDDILLVRVNRPAVQKSFLILAFPSRVINVAQMNDMLFPLLAFALEQFGP